MVGSTVTLSTYLLTIVMPCGSVLTHRHPGTIIGQLIHCVFLYENIKIYMFLFMFMLCTGLCKNIISKDMITSEHKNIRF